MWPSSDMIRLYNCAEDNIDKGMQIWEDAFYILKKIYFSFGACFIKLIAGLGFNIDEIVQAWNEMYGAKKWQPSVPSFRLEPLLRRRASEFYQVDKKIRTDFCSTCDLYSSASIYVRNLCWIMISCTGGRRLLQNEKHRPEGS